MNRIVSLLLQGQKRGTFNQAPPIVNRSITTSLSEEQLNIYALRYQGKLLLQEEFNLPAELFATLVKEQLLSPISSIEKTFLNHTCKRCQNQRHHYFQKIQCARCQVEHLYCRYCIKMGRVMECTPLYYWTGPTKMWMKYEDPCTWQGELTNAQRDAAFRMIEAFQMNRNLLIWAVTGSGKTEMLFPCITEALKMGKRICIATPRADVVRELLPRLQQAFDQVPIQGLYSGGSNRDATAQLIIATTHQLLRFQHAFDLLIIDEVDAFPFHQDDTLQFAAERARKKTSSMIYLTATPRRKQRQQMAKKLLDYVFVPIRYHLQLLPIPTFTYCISLQKDLAANKLPKSFVSWLQNRQVPERQLLIFVPTIRMSEQLLQPLQRLLDNLYDGKGNQPIVDAVHAEDEDREAKVNGFRQEHYTILLTTTILERGVTFPSIDVAVLHAGHQVFDEASLVQISGRAGRSADDPTGEVVFFHDGKTNSMVKAQADIVKMNKRATKYILGEDDM